MAKVIATALLISVAFLAGCQAKAPPLAAHDMQKRTTEFLPPEQAEAEFTQAVALAVKLRYQDAIAQFSRVLPSFETAGLRQRCGETLFWLGYCNEKLDRRQEAAAFYKRLLQKYPRVRAARLGGQRLTALQASWR